MGSLVRFHLYPLTFLKENEFVFKGKTRLMHQNTTRLFAFFDFKRASLGLKHLLYLLYAKELSRAHDLSVHNDAGS